MRWRNSSLRLSRSAADSSFQRRISIPCSDSSRLIRSLKTRACLTVSSPGQVQGVLQHLAGQPHPGALDRESGHHPADQPGHPDHEELVQVVREDGQEPDPLEQRDGFVFGEFEDAFVEPQPALLAVQEAFFGQIVLSLGLLGGRVG